MKKNIMLLAVIFFLNVIFNVSYAVAECPASDAKKELEKQRDSLRDECKRLKDKSSEIIEVCKNTTCNNIGQLKTAESQFSYCWAEASNIYFGWTTFASCEKALNSLRDDARKLEKAHENYKNGVDSYNYFIRDNK